MTFGWFVNKFCILSGTIASSQDRAPAILIACVCLHNHIIQEYIPFVDIFERMPCKNDDLDEVVPNPIAPLGMAYLPCLEFLHEHMRRPKHNLKKRGK